jgi:hypothetical protein
MGLHAYHAASIGVPDGYHGAPGGFQAPPWGSRGWEAGSGPWDADRSWRGAHQHFTHGCSSALYPRDADELSAIENPGFEIPHKVYCSSFRKRMP